MYPEKSSKVLTLRLLRAFSDQMNEEREMTYREREVNMRARNDLRSGRMGSFSRRGPGHSREAFSRGRRQGGVMKVSRCIGFGTKPGVVQYLVVVLDCAPFHSHQTDTHASNHTKVHLRPNSASLWRKLQKSDVD